MNKSNLQTSIEQIDFFKEKQNNSNSTPSFLSLSIYTFANKINKKNIILIGSILAAIVFINSGFHSIDTWKIQNNIKTQQVESLAQIKVNEKIALIKSIPQSEVTNILNYMEKTLALSKKYNQETLYYVDFFEKKDNLTTRNAGSFNAESIKQFEISKSLIQSRKEIISRTYEQIQKGFTKSLPIAEDNADVLEVFLTWKSMSDQNSAFIPGNLISIRNQLFNLGTAKMILAQNYVAEMMSKENKL